MGDLLLEEVLLVEEEDDGGLGEPLVVADGVKELHAFVHAVLTGSKHKERDVEVRSAGCHIHLLTTWGQ